MPRSRAATARRVGSYAPVFAALGDDTRLALVSRLSSSGPLSIVELTRGSEVSRQAVTKNLRVLEDAGLARAQREGRERVWELEPHRLAEARRCLDLISSDWDAAIGRLKQFVET